MGVESSHTTARASQSSYGKHRLTSALVTKLRRVLKMSESVTDVKHGLSLSEGTISTGLQRVLGGKKKLHWKKHDECWLKTMICTLLDK